MKLDIQAARAVAMAHLFEAAVNDTGPWHIRIGETAVPVVKVRTHKGVLFVAHFGAGVEGDVAWLLCRGEEKSSQPVEPLPEGFQFEWRIGLTNDQTEHIGV